MVADQEVPEQNKAGSVAVLQRPHMGEKLEQSVLNDVRNWQNLRYWSKWRKVLVSSD